MCWLLTTRWTTSARGRYVRKWEPHHCGHAHGEHCVARFEKEVEVKALIVDRLPHQRSRDQLTYLVAAWSMDAFVDRVAIAEVLHQAKVKDNLA